MIWEISIDTGGTFTDCLARSPEGERKELKILSSSRLKGRVIEAGSPCAIKIDAGWFAADIFEGYEIESNNLRYRITDSDHENQVLFLDKDLRELGETFDLVSPEEVPLFAIRLITRRGLNASLPPVHLRLGTTRGTNALLEKKGAKVSLFVTKGFKDLLVIGNQQRPNLFALNIEKPAPLTYEVIEVDERIDANGQILTSVKEFAPSLSAESVGISLLNSFKNDAHEQFIKQQIAELGVEHITISADVSGRMKYLERTETTVVNAYLSPILTTYLSDIVAKVESGFYVMTSAGTLTPSIRFAPKDSLLSGPAGGISGAASIAILEGRKKIVSFDMGGTSTDVSLYDDGFDYSYTTKVGGAHIQAPALNIHTIAAGGGSVCSFRNGLLNVGPESGGAFPGPACYGNGGALTLTDVNLLAGRLYPDAFSMPLDTSASDKARRKLSNVSGVEPQELLTVLLQIANEKMAAAIRRISIDRGTSLDDSSMVAFGGAGGQHACAIAEILGISEIIVPKVAGLLSAFGISNSEIGDFASKEMYISLDDSVADLENSFDGLGNELLQKLIEGGIKATIKERWVFMRLKGQETSLEIRYSHFDQLRNEFKKSYVNTYGHWIENRPIEITSIKIRAANSVHEIKSEDIPLNTEPAIPVDHRECLVGKEYVMAPVYDWDLLTAGTQIAGPAVMFSQNSTVFIQAGWQGTLSAHGSLILALMDSFQTESETTEGSAALQLFLNRFSSIVTDMGAVLERSSFSVNVKERLDFSCALLDADGYLVVNAPHIPVHLGSMGLCVREVISEFSLKDGDIIITNHPAYGGSHLPDITLIAPVVVNGVVIGYVANRAHHAEIGGITPGSMPPNATTLSEEGTIIQPQYLMQNHQANWDDIRALFISGPHPSRAVNENIADLQAGVASLQAGIRALRHLAGKFGTSNVTRFMQRLKSYVSERISDRRKDLPSNCHAVEYLDDQTKIEVSITHQLGEMVFDFSGTSPQHPGNYNATPAIVHSVVLYVLRLMMKESLPLNEGFLEGVDIILPKGSILNPKFTDPMPAVVGGNTEVSQRLCDTLLKAWNSGACSQGTMNNLIFGNENFGFYETIGGGTGAGQGFDGASGIHQHMTNTRITDPEIIEHNFPVRLHEFSIRKGSGGSGKWSGGNGITRIIEFLEKVEVSILSQHRASGPYGLEGGGAGAKGEQYILHMDGKITRLGGTAHQRCLPGDRIVISTPGGGGFGR